MVNEQNVIDARVFFNLSVTALGVASVVHHWRLSGVAGWMTIDTVNRRRGKISKDKVPNRKRSLSRRCGAFCRERPSTVVQLISGDDGELWLLSGGWFRGWYNRALENPEIELIRESKVLRVREGGFRRYHC